MISSSSTSWSMNQGSILVAWCTCSGSGTGTEGLHDDVELAVVRPSRLFQQFVVDSRFICGTKRRLRVFEAAQRLAQRFA